jgi:single-strand DNA-binding protein
MNKVQLIGRLTKDPELRYTKSNIAVASYTIAINTGYGEKVQTDFINITTWGKGGEFVKNYFKKGQAIAIVGRLRSYNYEDKDGNKRYMTEVVTEDIEFIGDKKKEEKQVEELPINQTGEEITWDDEDLPWN